MPTALIATLGFEEKFCYRAVLRHGIKDGDVIILFTAELVEKVERAFDWIKKLIQSSYGESVKVDLIQLDPMDPVKSIKRVLNVLDDLSDFRIIVNLSGGMRSIVVYVLLACMMRIKEGMRIEIEAEDLSGVTELDPKMLILIKEGAKEEWLHILRHIAEGKRDVKLLAEAMGKDESTVRRQLFTLKKYGLIEIKKRKPLVFEISPLADLLLS